MAQSAGYGAGTGKNPLGITAFWPSRCVGFGRDDNRGGGSADRKCFNCDQSGFSPEHIAKCPARNATCNFCRKNGHYERTCWGRKAANRERVGLIHEDGSKEELLQNDPEENV